MTYRIAAGLLVLPLLLGGVTPAQDYPGQSKGGGPAVAQDDEKPTLIKIVVPTKSEQTRALLHALQVDPGERVPGNAALLWLRAGRQAAQVKRVFTDEEYRWITPWRDGTSLEKIPQGKVAALLEPYLPALRIAHDAALREDCDWGEPPLTIANLHDYLPLDDIQSMRTLATMLRFQHRLALAKGDFKEALRCARTGLTLARHLGQSHLIITHLVAIAIQAVTMGMVEEMLALPNAANLYWALTDLPQPMIDVRRAFRHELNTYHRSFPLLRKLELAPETPLTQAEIMAIFTDVMRGLDPQQKGVPLQTSLLLTAVVSRYYSAAKQALLDRGIVADKVEKLPTAQVVGIYFLDEYNRFRDDVLKLQNLPAWQARPHLDALDKRLAVRMRDQSNPFLMLMPAIAKVAHASVRSERTTAHLRTVEVIRLHAAANGGALPAKLADIQVAPVPIDPATGQTFEAYYKKTPTGATLEVPPFPPLPAWAAHHYEFLTPRKETP